MYALTASLACPEQLGNLEMTIKTFATVSVTLEQLAP